MKIAVIYGCLLSIAFATPIPKETHKSAWGKLDEKQLAEIQKDVQTLSALAAKVLPSVYADLEAQNLLNSPEDYNVDAQANYRSSVENDNLDKEEDYESDDTYSSLNYKTLEESDNKDKAKEKVDYVFSGVKDNTKHKHPSSPEAIKKSEETASKESDEPASDEKASEESKEKTSRKSDEKANKDSDEKASKESGEMVQNPKGQADNLKKKKHE